MRTMHPDKAKLWLLDVLATRDAGQVGKALSSLPADPELRRNIAQPVLACAVNECPMALWDLLDALPLVEGDIPLVEQVLADATYKISDEERIALAFHVSAKGSCKREQALDAWARTTPDPALLAQVMPPEGASDISRWTVATQVMHRYTASADMIASIGILLLPEFRKSTGRVHVLYEHYLEKMFRAAYGDLKANEQMVALLIEVGQTHFPQITDILTRQVPLASQQTPCDGKCMHLRQLLDAGARLDLGHQAMFAVAQAGDVELFHRFLDAGLDPKHCMDEPQHRSLLDWLEGCRECPQSGTPLQWQLVQSYFARLGAAQMEQQTPQAAGEDRSRRI